MSTDRKSEKDKSSTDESGLVDECRALKNDIKAKRDEFREELDKIESEINKINNNGKED